jgi:hypothetical protein
MAGRVTWNRAGRCHPASERRIASLRTRCGTPTVLRSIARCEVRRVPRGAATKLDVEVWPQAALVQRDQVITIAGALCSGLFERAQLGAAQTLQASCSLRETWQSDHSLRARNGKLSGTLLLCAWTGFLDRGPKPRFNL